jgi:hypothetical protein
MHSGQSVDTGLSLPGQFDPYQPAIAAVPHPNDQAGRRSPVDQTDDAVVLTDQVIGDFADCGAPIVGVSAYREQQLMLGRRQPGIAGLLLAPLLESPQSGSERQKVAVLAVSRPPHAATPGLCRHATPAVAVHRSILDLQKYRSAI